MKQMKYIQQNHSKDPYTMLTRRITKRFASESLLTWQALWQYTFKILSVAVEKNKVQMEIQVFFLLVMDVSVAMKDFHSPPDLIFKLNPIKYLNT